ncbi:MAG: DUF4921 family protein [Pirellulaceae bacterium]|nr:DUF4921 family protein [Pirellulaceae bacterium]
MNRPSATLDQPSSVALRQDPLSGRWVLIAEQRAARPQGFVVTSQTRPGTLCPFCRGHEAETPTSLASYPAAEESPGQVPDWLVRVVPNKYPAVGSHEVIIESPRHVVSLAELTDDELHWTFIAYRDRLRALASQDDIAYGQVFKNVGPSAGASLEHVHSQLIGLPIVPSGVQRELDHFRQHAQGAGRCLLCELIGNEQADGTRVVEQSGSCLAWCPYASRFPFEVWLAPRQHLTGFEQSSLEVIGDAAMLARRVLARLEACQPKVNYNYYLHTSPLRPRPGDDFHWHLEILPRLTRTAGFEWATEMHINPVAPETAANLLGERGA